MAGGLSKATVRHTPPVVLSPSAFPFFWALSPVQEDGQAGLAVQVAGGLSRPTPLHGWCWDIFTS